jgi:hypothetical protein
MSSWKYHILIRTEFKSFASLFFENQKCVIQKGALHHVTTTTRVSISGNAFLPRLHLLVHLNFNPVDGLPDFQRYHPVVLVQNDNGDILAGTFLVLPHHYAEIKAESPVDLNMLSGRYADFLER